MIASASAQKPQFVAGEAIVRLKGGVGIASASDNFADKYGATIKDSFDFGNLGIADQGEILHIKLPEGLSTEAALAKMAQDPQIAYAEPNYEFQLDDVRATNVVTEEELAAQLKRANGEQDGVIPNDLDPKLWGLHNTGQNGGKAGADISATKAWKQHVGRTDGPIIAVIDTGIDYNHPDLKDNMWVNPGEIPGNGEDNDGNGVIDDVYGYNAFADNGDPMDGHSHGTHCAGTIGAVGDNGIGVVGVNHKARLMAIKIFSDSGSTNTAAILRGINYATKMGATITSNSWGGGPFSQAQKDAFAASPALHIIAAGNNGRDNDKFDNFPSNYDIPNKVAVAASDRFDNKARFSQYGVKNVEIAAPGVDVFSTIPGAKYGNMSGTSMATPHVSGVAGLVASAFPELDAQGIKDKVLNGADQLENWKQFVTDGRRLNAEGALNA